MKPPAQNTPLRLVAADQTPRAGGTPVRDCPELARHFGLSSLRVKDESENPFGTHKDRKSQYVISKVLEMPSDQRPDAICIFTSGNAGLSLAGFASPHGIPIVAIVDENQIAAQPLGMLRQTCQKVESIDASRRRWSEKDLRLVAGEAKGARVIDATNCHAAYAVLVDELAHECPDVLVLPVVVGELFLGVHDRLRAHGWATRLIGVTVANKDSIADKLYAHWTPHRARIEKLCESPSPHRITTLHDEDALRRTWTDVAAHLRCEASGAAPFEALRLTRIKQNERVLVVNSGIHRPLTSSQG